MTIVSALTLKTSNSERVAPWLCDSISVWGSSSAQPTLEPANLLETGARNEILSALSFPGSVRRLSGEAVKHNGATDECYVFRQP